MILTGRVSHSDAERASVTLYPVGKGELSDDQNFALEQLSVNGRDQAAPQTDLVHAEFSQAKLSGHQLRLGNDARFAILTGDDLPSDAPDRFAVHLVGFPSDANGNVLAILDEGEL